MTKFNKGDSFTPRKPKQQNNYEGWADGMNSLEGKTLKVSKITINGWLQDYSSGYCFHPDWCEKVSIGVDIGKGEDTSAIYELGEMVSSSEFPNNHTMKAGIFDEHIRGELDLLENKKLITEQPSSPQPISTEIDWEQRRYELTKEFVAAKIFWIGYEKITNQVITRTIEIADEVIKQLKRQ